MFENFNASTCMVILLNPRASHWFVVVSMVKCTNTVVIGFASTLKFYLHCMTSGEKLKANSQAVMLLHRQFESGETTGDKIQKASGPHHHFLSSTNWTTFVRFSTSSRESLKWKRVSVFLFSFFSFFIFFKFSF